jgi:hypothetical protein
VTHLDILVRHADVLGVGLQILGRGHDGELDGPLIAKCLVCPLPHGADLLDCRNTVVCNEHLQGTVELAAEFPVASLFIACKGRVGCRSHL